MSLPVRELILLRRLEKAHHKRELAVRIKQGMRVPKHGSTQTAPMSRFRSGLILGMPGGEENFHESRAVFHKSAYSICTLHCKYQLKEVGR